MTPSEKFMSMVSPVVEIPEDSENRSFFTKALRGIVDQLHSLDYFHMSLIEPLIDKIEAWEDLDDDEELILYSWITSALDYLKEESEFASKHNYSIKIDFLEDALDCI